MKQKKSDNSQISSIKDQSNDNYSLRRAPEINNALEHSMKVSGQNIRRVEQEIYDEFMLIRDDREAYLDHIMDLGDQLDSISDSDKNEENRINGCISAVWITADIDSPSITFKGDSNTKITKGLVALLFRILNNNSMRAIIDYDLSFFEKIHLESFIGSQRKGGLVSILGHMKNICKDNLGIG